MKILIKFLAAVLVVSALGNYTHGVYAASCEGDYPNQTAPAGTCCVIHEEGADGNGTIINNCGTGNLAEKTADGTDCLCQLADATALGSLFTTINGVMLPLVVIGGVFLIVRAGYKILTSQGNPQELQEGKENLTSAIIGLVFVLMAVSILRVIIKALITGNADIGF